MADENEEEVEVLRKELKWLLENQVHCVLEEISQTLSECGRRFPHKPGLDENKNLVTPQRLLLSGQSGGNGSVKCVVTMVGDSICDADISFKHKLAKDNHHLFKTVIGSDASWKLQQVQDAGNFLYTAVGLMERPQNSHVYTSAKEVISLLDNIGDNLNQGRSCLAYPKRKSLEELLNTRNMQTLSPQVPNDVVMSFYIHASKLVLSVYHLTYNNVNQKLEITARHQVECMVQWLNEAVTLFSLALQQCQQLKDKITLLQNYDEES